MLPTLKATVTRRREQMIERIKKDPSIILEIADKEQLDKMAAALDKLKDLFGADEFAPLKEIYAGLVRANDDMGELRSLPLWRSTKIAKIIPFVNNGPVGAISDLAALTVAVTRMLEQLPKEIHVAKGWFEPRGIDEEPFEAEEQTTTTSEMQADDDDENYSNKDDREAAQRPISDNESLSTEEWIQCKRCGDNINASESAYNDIAVCGTCGEANERPNTQSLPEAKEPKWKLDQSMPLDQALSNRTLARLKKIVKNSLSPSTWRTKAKLPYIDTDKAAREVLSLSFDDIGKLAKLAVKTAGKKLRAAARSQEINAAAVQSIERHTDMMNTPGPEIPDIEEPAAAPAAASGGGLRPSMFKLPGADKAKSGLSKIAQGIGMIPDVIDPAGAEKRADARLSGDIDADIAAEDQQVAAPQSAMKPISPAYLAQEVNKMLRAAKIEAMQITDKKVQPGQNLGTELSLIRNILVGRPDDNGKFSNSTDGLLIKLLRQRGLIK